jgi:uncharacterized membrane protein (DUF485 family)
VTVLGTFIMLATYTLFYIMTVYSMTFSTGPKASASRPATGTITPKPMTAIISIHSTSLRGKPAKVAAAKKQVKIPLGTLLTKHVRVTVLGTFIMLATYTLFYIMTVYSMTE